MAATALVDDHARAEAAKRAITVAFDPEFYRAIYTDLPAEMDALWHYCVAGWSEARRRNAARYTGGLSGGSAVRTPVTAPGNEHIFHQYTLQVDRRDELQAFLRGREIGTAVYYPLALHLQPCFAYLGYREGQLPVTEAAMRRVISLPVYPELTTAQQDWVIESIRAFYD